MKNHPVGPWSLLYYQNIHIVINQSVKFLESGLSTVILKTAPAPACEIEIDLKIGVSL